MSQMPSFFRGYRQALRDVQLAVLLRGRTRSGSPSAWSAVLVAGDLISVPLRQLRETGVRSLDSDVREFVSTPSAKQIDFVMGYQVGFDKAVEIVADWGDKMNNSAARDAIGETVERLQQARLHMIFRQSREDGNPSKAKVCDLIVKSGEFEMQATSPSNNHNAIWYDWRCWTSDAALRSGATRTRPEFVSDGRPHR